ncbi:MAG TPA: response regulator [Myxococcota bacterium]|nr:response regulator [Myxococcota bacterium]
MQRAQIAAKLRIVGRDTEKHLRAIPTGDYPYCPGVALGLLMLFHWPQAALEAISLDRIIVLSIFAAELILIAVVMVVARRISSRNVVRARQLATLAELGQRALETDNLSELLDLAVSRVGRALGVELVELLELQGDQGRLKLRAGHGFRNGVVGSEVLNLTHSWRVEQALDSGKPVIMGRGVRERRSQRDALLFEHGVRSGITVPIPGRGSGFGTLGAHSRKRRRLRTEDTHFLEAAASLLAIAIEGRRTDQEARANQRTLAFLNEASNQLAAALDPEAVLETLARVVLPFLADFLLIDLVGEDGRMQRLVGTSSDPKSELRTVNRGKASPLQLVAAANGRVDVHRARYASDATAEELQRIAADPEQLELLRRGDLSSVMIVPLSAPRKVLGSLCLGARPPRSRYGPAELALASDLARRVALALDKAPNHKERAEVDPRKGEFRAMLSRELRDSIATLSNAIEVLRLGEADSAKSRAIENAAGQVSSMNRLVADLLDVSNTTHGTIQLHRESLELGALAQRAIESVRWAAALHAQEIELVLPDAPLWIDGDSVRLEQIVGTLVDRAAKSGGHETTIRVRIEAHAEETRGVVRIWEEGDGISPKSLSQLSDASPFEAVTAEPTDLGVDLYLVQCLVQLHGGEVYFHHRGAQGEREFVVRLPSIPVPTWSSTRHSGTAEETSGVRVLVVDDHQDLATGLAELLERWGHEARVAFDGPSGLEAARGFQPDLVLLDLGLPGMDGFAVAQTLRRELSLSSVEVAAVTGYAHADDRRRARESGIDHYFTKPVDLAALRRLLESRLGKARRTRAEFR